MCGDNREMLIDHWAGTLRAPATGQKEHESPLCYNFLYRVQGSRVPGVRSSQCLPSYICLRLLLGAWPQRPLGAGSVSMSCRLSS